jgi:hypothetical protein
MRLERGPPAPMSYDICRTERLRVDAAATAMIDAAQSQSRSVRLWPAMAPPATSPIGAAPTPASITSDITRPIMSGCTRRCTQLNR